MGWGDTAVGGAAVKGGVAVGASATLPICMVITSTLLILIFKCPGF